MREYDDGFNSMIKRTVVHGDWKIRISRQVDFGNGNTWLALAEKRVGGVVKWVNAEGRTEEEAVRKVKIRLKETKS